MLVNGCNLDDSSMRSEQTAQVVPINVHIGIYYIMIIDIIVRIKFKVHIYIIHMYILYIFNLII